MWVERYRLTARSMRMFELHRSSIRSSRTSALFRHDSQPATGSSRPASVGIVEGAIRVERWEERRSRHAGSVLGRRKRANRNGSGTFKGTAASANRRDDEDDEPVEPLKPSLATPCPESPNGTVGRTSATGCFLAAFESGGGRASTLRTVTWATARAIAARTSGRDVYVSATRRCATARACLQSCESGTRASRSSAGLVNEWPGGGLDGCDRAHGPEDRLVGRQQRDRRRGGPRPEAHDQRRGSRQPARRSSPVRSRLPPARRRQSPGPGRSTPRAVPTTRTARRAGCAAAAGCGAAGAAGAAGSSLTASLGCRRAGSSSAGVVSAGGVLSGSGAGVSAVPPPPSPDGGGSGVAGGSFGAGAGLGGGACGFGSAGSGSAGGGVGGSAAVVSAGVVSAGGAGLASSANAGSADPSATAAVARKATPNRPTPIDRFLLAANGVSSR